MRHAARLVVCASAVGLAAPASASALVFEKPHGDVRCSQKGKQRTLVIGVTGRLDDLSRPWGTDPAPPLFLETTINLREQYGQRHRGTPTPDRWTGLKWKRYPTKIARSLVFVSPYGDYSVPEALKSPMTGGGRRVYSGKAFRRLRQLKGSASVALKNAQSGETYAETDAKRFRYTDNRDGEAACMLASHPEGNPIVNAG
jgi:hypothetical protein